MWFLGVLPWGQLRGLNPQTRVAPERLNRKRQEDRPGAASAENDRGNCSPGAERTQPPWAQLESRV